MGSQLKRIRRNVQGGSPNQVARRVEVAEASIARNVAWAEGVIAAHETEERRATWERRTLALLLVLFWAGVIVAIARGCG